jgi:divalent metal cation (Fe/Co/Zn/Cd) transporter
MSNGATISPVQSEMESAIAQTLRGDAAIFLLRIPFILFTGSLTMLSEGVRSAFTFGASINAYLVTRAMHRGRLSRFAFGIGKIEQLTAMVLGVGLTISGLFVAQKIVSTIFAPVGAAAPYGLALAAIFNFANVLKNAIGWLSLRAAAEKEELTIYRVQVRARFTMMVATLILQVTLTAAAVARDDVAALILDAVGACFVSGYMVYRGLSLISPSAPVLLDAAAPREIADKVRRTAADFIPEGEIVGVRTRRLGRAISAEVRVRGDAWTGVAPLRTCAEAIQTALRNDAFEVEIVVTLAPESAEAASFA